jgi:hypothetical protein
MKNWIFKDESSSPPDHKWARTRAMLLSLPFAIVGILALIFLLHDEVGSGFRMERQKAMGLLSAAVVCGGLIALIFGISAKKQALRAADLKPLDEEKPWLKREDWAAARITSGTRKSVLLLWIFTFFWNAVSAPVVFIGLPSELHKGNHAILIALLFPIVGIGMIIYALNTTLAWRKFGQSIFEMAAIPAALGSTLEGEIQVNRRLRPEHGLHLRLSCIRRMTTGSGKNRSTNEKILWQDDRWLRPDLPQTDLNATGIPVYFKLPADQPESTPGSGDGIHWKLEASAKLRGPNFHATFDVPVFKLPEPPDISDDPTTPYQMSLDEMRQQIHSKIRVNDLPDGGKEFIFPAARNVVPAAGLTVIWLIWTGIVVALFWNWKQVPAIFPLLFGVFDLLIGLFAFDFWFRRSRVVVTPTQMQIETSWPGFKKRRTLEASQVVSIAADIGATTGHTAYHDLKVRLRDGREITVAKNLGVKPEADWLVRQMIAAGKPIAATDSKA